MKKRSIGITLSYVYFVLNSVLGLFLSSFLLRKLGDTEYGLYQTISAFVNYLVILEFGVGTVITRNIVSARNKGEDEVRKNITTLFYLTFFLSFLILIIAIIFYFSIEGIYHNTIPAEQMTYAKNMFLILVLYLLFSFFSNTLRGTLFGFENYSLSQVLNIISLCLRVLFVVLVLSIYKYAIYVVIINTTLMFITFLYMLIYCIKKYKISFKFSNFDTKILKYSLPFCFALLMETIVNQANSSVDKFAISIMMSLESVSLYSVAAYIYGMFCSIMITPVSMYLPEVTKEIELGRRGRDLTNTLVKSSRFITLIGGSILFGFIAIGNQFIHIIYGSNYVKAWLFTIVLLVPKFIDMTNGCSINVSSALNKRHVNSFIMFSATIINIILTIIFIKSWGILGAVIATAISLTLGNIVALNFYYHKLFDFKIFYFFRKTYSGILPSLIIAGVVAYVIGKTIKNVYLSFIVGGCVFLIIEICCLMLFGLNKNEKNKIKNFTNRILKKNKNNAPKTNDL